MGPLVRGNGENFYIYSIRSIESVLLQTGRRLCLITFHRQAYGGMNLGQSEGELDGSKVATVAVRFYDRQADYNQYGADFRSFNSLSVLS